MRAQIGLLFAFLFACQMSAQDTRSLQISGQIKGYSNQVILLQDYAAHRSRTIDSVKTDAAGNFTFSPINQPYRGMYRLMLKNDSEDYIVVLSSDEKIRIVGKYELDHLEYQFLEGNDNIAGEEYQNEAQDIRLRKQALNELIQFLYKPDDKFYKQLQKEISRLDVKAEKQKSVFYKRTSENSLARLYVKFANHFSEEALETRSSGGCTNFWQGIDYSNEAAFRSNLLIEQIPYYFIDCDFLYKGQMPENDSYRNIVDDVLTAFVANKPLYEAAIDYLLIGFEQAGSADMMEYIINTYVLGDGCDVEARYPSITDKIAKNRQLQPGAWAQNLTLTNANGQKVTFDASKEQKQLLVFWSSSCPHCMEEMPKLGSALDVLQTQNIALYTVALEVDKNEWFAALEQNKLTTSGNHVSELKGWDGSATETYPILSLPAIFIIQNGKIVGKYRSIEEAVQTIQAR